MHIVLGSDHGGFALKNEVAKHLSEKGYKIFDVGTYKPESCDYPEFARRAAKEIINNNADKGIIFCGTGIGISIAANKINGIRCAKVSNEFEAKMSVKHNNANMISLGGRVLGKDLAFAIVDTYLNEEFEGGRHQRRIEEIAYLEKGNIDKEIVF